MLGEAIGNKIKKVDREIELKRPYEIVESYADSIIRSKEHPLEFGIPSIDKVLMGDLRGKTAAIIGYGGTKKSLLSLNMVNHNANQHKSNAVYNSAEMSLNAMLGRMIDYSTEPSQKPLSNHLQNASRHIRQNLVKENRDSLVEILKNGLKEFYGDSLFINSKNGMTYQKYKKLIGRYKEITNSELDILAVDGLSMMGGEGNETSRVDENTMMLNELAKEEDIFIPIIVHASKGESKHCRDLSHKARGSEKIVDNVDMVFTCSLIQDKINTGMYLNDLGYIRLWDKRGSGDIVSVVYDFDPHKLIMTESHIDPLDVEIEESTSFSKKY
tara:strand:+ start:1268 stop:2251 length:984 start_codon:yes stop_codon:yes gene_type:complete